MQTRTQILIVAALVSNTLANPAWSDTEDERPNVILIYSDDQGSLDVNCYGSDDLITPTMDRLASTGVRFTQMYAPSAICSASRCGLLTGRFPARSGVPGNVSSQPGTAGMPTEQVTLAEALKAAGYATGHVGKWHLGYTPETMPNGQGFDSSFGHMGGCIDNYSHFFYWSGPNRHDLWRNGREVWMPGQFFGDLMVQECKQFIEQHQHDPFFLYWAINWPHYPLQGTDKWCAKYRHLKHPRDKYATFVSTLDERIGMVLEHVERLGLRKRTLIIFQSDHGHSTEERQFSGGGNAGRYRGAKGCLFEGGLRVPSIVSMPGTVPAGEVRSQMVTGCDWFPTILEVCAVPPPANRRLDGRSIVSVIQSSQAASPHRAFYWQLGRGPAAQWVVREGPWKLLGNPRDTSKKAPLTDKDKHFLVNLQMDVEERKNLVEQFPEVARRLRQQQKEFVKELSQQ